MQVKQQQREVSNEITMVGDKVKENNYLPMDLKYRVSVTIGFQFFQFDFQDGLEKIEVAYKKFMEADREQIELWKNFIIDLEVTAEQSLNPRRIQEFLTMIFNNGGLDMTVHIMDYIITVRSKMLLIITCYHAFNNANDQVRQAFKTFNEEYQEYLEAFKKVTECKYQPGTSGTLLLYLTRWKLDDLEPIFRREGVDFEDLLKMSKEEKVI